MESVHRLLLRSLLLCLLLLFATRIAFTDSVSGDDDFISGTGDLGEVGLVGEEVDDFFNTDVLGSAAGVETVFYFPKNPGKLVPAGDTQEVLVGISNFGEITLKVSSIRASLNLPFDHRVFVQNFTAQEFANATVPPGVQASFSYSFTVNKYLQPGGFALVASIFYEIDDQQHKSVFYNGTIEVEEASGFFSGETLFLITLGLGLLGLFGMWVSGQVQRLSKKTRRTKKVETGTRSSSTTDSASNEWLQGTSFTMKQSKSISQSTKAKKKK